MKKKIKGMEHKCLRKLNNAMVHHQVFGRTKHNDIVVQSWQEQWIKHIKHVILQHKTSILHNSWFATTNHQQFWILPRPVNEPNEHERDMFMFVCLSLNEHEHEHEHLNERKIMFLFVHLANEDVRVRSCSLIKMLNEHKQTQANGNEHKRTQTNTYFKN